MAVTPSFHEWVINSSSRCIQVNQTDKLCSVEGSEVGKIRPALINADFPMVVVTQVRRDVSTLRITLANRDDLQEDCQIMADQPRTFDRRHLGQGPLHPAYSYPDTHLMGSFPAPLLKADTHPNGDTAIGTLLGACPRIGNLLRKS